MDAPMIRTKATIDDWEAYGEHDGFLELIEGEIMMAGGGSPKHQRFSSKLFSTVSSARPDGQTYHAATGIRLDDANVPEPDLIWIAPETAMRETNAYLMGIPDLVGEIISPTSVIRDRVDKRALYQRVGVREYWLIDLANEAIEVLVLIDDLYHLQGAYKPGETFASPVLGVTVDLGAAWAAARQGF